MGKLLIVGTVAFDAIETPFGKTDKILGGAATFIGLAASQFNIDTSIVSVVGGDFPQKYLDSNATFGGFKPANDVNRFSLQGVQNASQLNKGNFILGNKNLPKPKTTYAHEQQHGFQVGRTTPLDKDLSSGIKPNKEVLDYNKKYDKFSAKSFKN